MKGYSLIIQLVITKQINGLSEILDILYVKKKKIKSYNTNQDNLINVKMSVLSWWLLMDISYNSIDPAVSTTT